MKCDCFGVFGTIQAGYNPFQGPRKIIVVLAVHILCKLKIAILATLKEETAIFPSSISIEVFKPYLLCCPLLTDAEIHAEQRPAQQRLVHTSRLCRPVTKRKCTRTRQSFAKYRDGWLSFDHHPNSFCLEQPVAYWIWNPRPFAEENVSRRYGED